MDPYEPGSAIVEMQRHFDSLREHHPELYECVDPERALDWARECALTGDVRDDFGQERGGGRGESYLRAQAENVRARARGIETLLGYVRTGTASTRKTVVDVLGGDGLVRRVAGVLGLSDIVVLTCDASPYMVREAWAAGHPALRQRADRMVARDNSVDGVLVAYGSHHIAAEDRADVAREAYRVLRPGGVLVLHDFAVGSPMDDWFAEVVDPYSLTGHRFEHFTREEIAGYLVKAGFESYEVADIADPYVATAPTAHAAELELGRYLLDMYGLEKVRQTWGPRADQWTIDRAKSIFRYPLENGTTETFSLDYDPEAANWRATVPRMAVVGIGRKLL